MSKNSKYKYEGYGVVRDTEIDFPYHTDDIVDLLDEKDQQISDLEAKLAESEEKKESYRLQNEQHHLQLLQFYSRLGVEAFGADIHEKALETLMIMKERLAITEKALELACDYLVSNGNEDDELYKLVQNIYDDDKYLATKINYFKTKAKEMLENE